VTITKITFTDEEQSYGTRKKSTTFQVRFILKFAKPRKRDWNSSVLHCPANWDESTKWHQVCCRCLL